MYDINSLKSKVKELLQSNSNIQDIDQIYSKIIKSKEFLEIAQSKNEIEEKYKQVGMLVENYNENQSADNEGKKLADEVRIKYNIQGHYPTKEEIQDECQRIYIKLLIDYYESFDLNDDIYTKQLERKLENVSQTTPLL